MAKYMKEIKGTLVIRENDKGLLEKYDTNKRQWVRDFELSRIYTGSLLVEPISEAEANKLIGR